VRVQVTIAERRARMIARHHLAGDAPDAMTAITDLVAMHTSDPTTPHLGVVARTSGGSRASTRAGDPIHGAPDLADALYRRRILWRLHAMRRTLFVIPTDRAGEVHAAVGRDVAVRERQRLEVRVEAERSARSARRLLDAAQTAVLDGLGDEEVSTRDLLAWAPVLATSIPVGSGAWSSRASLGSRLLQVLAAEGRVVRARPAGSWRSSQYRWTRADAWFDRAPDPVAPEAGRAALAQRYLARFGPITLTDLRWWAGWTAAHARQALAIVDAIAIRLEDGDEPGWVLPGDLEGPGPGDVTDGVALLPALDPTPMGWAGREWYIGPHAASLFDRNGNVGPTVWAGGRIVGGWGQRRDGTVVARLLEPVPADVAEQVDARAAELQAWLGDTVVLPRFRTPTERAIHDGR
jgi:hypothetical protein